MISPEFHIWHFHYGWLICGNYFTRDDGVRFAYVMDEYGVAMSLPMSEIEVW